MHFVGYMLWGVGEIVKCSYSPPTPEIFFQYQPQSTLQIIHLPLPLKFFFIPHPERLTSYTLTTPEIFFHSPPQNTLQLIHSLLLNFFFNTNLRPTTK
jgi:hypothetical protein